MDAAKIQEAVALLDPADDTHWTESGKPSIKALEELLGEKLSRAEVNIAAKDAVRPTARAGSASSSPAPAVPTPEKVADVSSRAAASRGVTAEEMSARARREAAEKALGEEDPRTAALAAARGDVGDRLRRLMTREERIKNIDGKRLRNSVDYLANAKIAAEKGTHAAPDFVAGRDVIVHDRYYYEGRFYEVGQKILGFVGRLGLKMELAD